ncbi:MAG TPA: DHHA1 domain-containing protein [Anaerolineae bacterium]|nr:DHHA1 domain-containing protein [Anaerolineae bacterium]
MTDRLYYSDSRLHTFEAKIRNRLEHDGRPAVILDRSAFYPDSGGQPADRGMLNQAQVVDVIVREADGEVLHVLSEPITTDHVSGSIDPVRRFDFMQQHTGQHILSQAFSQVAEAETVSFHLNPEPDGGVTIDLDTINLRPDQVDRVEDIANSIIYENRPIAARFVTSAELKSIPLRKPPAVTESIRIVEIQYFDWSACGGTHVASTGEVGLIKITKLDRRGNETRVEFLCGRRALIDYRRKSQMISRVAADLTIGYWELDQTVARLQADNKAIRRQLNEADARLQQYEAQELLSRLEASGEYGVAARVWIDRDAAYIKRMAQLLTASPKTVALLGATGKSTSLMFARSKDVPSIDLSALLKTAAAKLGGKGGGSADFAQAGGPAVSAEQVKEVIDWAKDQLKR